MASWHFLLLLVLAGGSLAETGTLLCAFSGKLRRMQNGDVAWYESKEMKQRALRKVDVGKFLKEADVKGTALLDVLVDATGKVVCVKNSTAHPLIRVEVEDAVKQWTFQVDNSVGAPVAYLGRLRFDLCNILCGEKGPSMTLLK